jgi:23S rRNA (cytidine1920-2'-O)/16S rRNA (cytidine1409-2'-O)-methyltransferase
VRRRLDAELVRRGLVPSRAGAVAAVNEGRVLVAGAPATSPARQVGVDEAISVSGAAPAFVSRGGIKLAAALDAFAVDPSGRWCVDVGASTGGFTDCLLQRGAAHVVAIDVGRGQLAWSLRTDPRVTVMERTNVRTLDAGALQPVPDLCVADVSFISLRTIAPHVVAFTVPESDYVMLIKPQFEAGRARVGKGGIVRDPVVRAAVVAEVVSDLEAQGLGVVALITSPITGAEGNIEYLAHAVRGRTSIDRAVIDAVVRGTE